MPKALPVLLVVDDDEDVRLMLRLFLESEGFEIVEAANGQLALARLEDGLRPQLIVLDLMMPVMSGLEFRERQRATQELADIPVVVFSASPDMKASALGGVTVLPKPVDADHLLTTLRALSSA